MAKLTVMTFIAGKIVLRRGESLRRVLCLRWQLTCNSVSHPDSFSILVDVCFRLGVFYARGRSCEVLFVCAFFLACMWSLRLLSLNCFSLCSCLKILVFRANNCMHIFASSGRCEDTFRRLFYDLDSFWSHVVWYLSAGSQNFYALDLDLDSPCIESQCIKSQSIESQGVVGLERTICSVHSSAAWGACDVISRILFPCLCCPYFCCSRSVTIRQQNDDDVIVYWTISHRGKILISCVAKVKSQDPVNSFDGQARGLSGFVSFDVLCKQIQ